jgi:hypothetical protein
MAFSNLMVEYPRFTLLKASISLCILHPILVTIGLRRQIFFSIGCALGSCGTGRDERDEEDELQNMN